MTGTQERSEEETTQAATAFVDAIDQAVHILDIQPRLTVILLGFFSRRVVDLLVKAGRDPGEANASVVGAFMEGLGLETFVEEVRGEEAEQIRARFERNNTDTPLQ